MTDTTQVRATRNCVIEAPGFYPRGLNARDVVDLNVLFLPSALAQGCELVDQSSESEAAAIEAIEAFETKLEARRTEILDVVKQLVVDGIANNFTADNKLKTAAVVKAVGFKVSAEEVDTALTIAMAGSAD